MATEIYRDAWGIPHLRAGDAFELARGQGRVTALDRAWQLEVERHRAQGTSAAFLGAEAVGWDVFARRARLDDTARRCYATLEGRDPETAAWVRAYAEGVNEGLAQGAVAAPEFAATGLAPGRWEPWTPLGVWLATHILFAGFPAKLWREQVAAHLGADAIALFATDGPGTSGSNGWLVSGERSVTGLPLIAGDPHRYIEAPGVYQQVRLSCPEFDVVGLAVPGVPGIAHFGHTGTVAWAITNAMADYQDLYVERLRRTGTPLARKGVEALDPDGEWRAADVHVEVVDVAGGEPVEVEVIETRRGPVVIGPDEHHGDDGDRAETISLRCPPRVTGDLGFSALLPLLRARSVADVDRAVDLWAEPVNVVQAADTEGGLLHRVAGHVPVRAEANRTRLVRAWEPGHEWHGRHETPYGTVDDGLAVMANQRGPATPLGVEFAPPHRAARIRALLEERDRWSAAELPALHMDTHLASAAPLLDLLADLDGLTPEETALRDQLLRWDRRMDADSTEAAAYAALRSAVVRRLAAHPAFAALADPPPYPEVFLPWLALLPRIAFALEGLLKARELYGIDRAAAVREALAEVAAEAVSVTWGERHRLAPWRASATSPHSAYDEPGLSGDHDCVLCTSSVPGLTDLSARGPAARYVWDLARREDSLWVVPFGASGVPGSAHHRDQLPLWTRGDLVPVVTDWARLTREYPPRPTSMYEARAAVHEQVADGFGTVRVLRLDPVADAGVVHGWVSEPRSAFWGMNGLSEEQVAEIYGHLDTLDTHHAYLLVQDGTAVGLLQTYEPEADRVSECYAVEPGDIGVHLLLAPAGAEGGRPGWSAALMAVLAQYVLVVLGRRRVVVDPDVGNEKAVARFLRQGFVAGPVVVLPEIDLPDVYLPEKRAQLAFLSREVAFPG
ncbi:GNAT family N-acetyltransferase [Streptomyces sp. NBC_00459]|uniref:GNAT family N-acetyltransferase n=1 Tax=Streptomyces sp. NBC_00459 TaxID=2975749 RepID=UPI002E18F5F9